MTEVDESGQESIAGPELAMQAMLDLAEPQPRYRRLIEEGGLLEPIEGMALSFARLDTDYVLRHHELFSSRVEMHLGNIRPLIPLNVDPPRHSKYRKLLDPLFAPKRMEEQDGDITRRINALIDGLIDRGECNFTDEVAEVFPTSVFLGLMGLPEDELGMFLRLRDGVLHPEKFDPDASFDMEKRMAVVNSTGREIYAYFAELISMRQMKPSNDIITRFLSNEIDGEKLTEEEILDICFLFLIAGLDTVTDSLTCFYAFLARNPQHRRQIVDDPALIPSAVEELLRWETPVPAGVPRLALDDVELPGGRTIAKGTAVVVSYGGANVDPAAFANPFEVRFDRDPNPHIAFGGGVHRCLGSHLARREMRIALREWHRRIPEYQLTPGHEDLVYSAGLRHVKNLMLSWGPDMRMFPGTAT